MQRVGKFQMGEVFQYHELNQMYESLTLMKDLTPRKQTIYVAITETHFLVFRELPEKNRSSGEYRGAVVTSEKESLIESEATNNKLKLTASAEIQCIDTILFFEEEQTVKLLVKKYKSIKLYNESEDIKRQYRFSQPEIFLRGVLKYITKFQPCHIDFEPGAIQTNARGRKNSAY